jgi:CRISPR system Cascade subunit CasB
LSIQKNERFVDFVLEKIHKRGDKGFAAKLKKADNETTEYQSWEILSQWTDLEDEKARRAYGLVGASLARGKNSFDGSLGLGNALHAAFSDKQEAGSAEDSSSAARLRRILACKDSLELIDILRPILHFLESKEINISKARLLDEILWFNNDSSRERTRTRWAQEFYGHKEQA